MEEIETKLQQIIEERPKTGFLEKLKLHKFKILGGVLGVLIFAGVVFGAYKIGQRQIQPVPQPTPIPIAVATPTPDPTANRKTYTSDDIGFSIKYPENWYFEENPDFQKPYLVEDALEVKVQFANFKPPFKGPAGSIPQGCWFDILAADTEMSLDQFITKNPTVGSLQGLPDRRERVVVDGRPAEKRVYLPNEFIFETRITVHAADTGKVVVFYYSSPLAEQAVDCEQTFNLMLSTFKFLE